MSLRGCWPLRRAYLDRDGFNRAGAGAYIWVVISLLMLVNLHLKLRAQMEVITALARIIALDNAARDLAVGATPRETPPALPQ